MVVRWDVTMYGNIIKLDAEFFTLLESWSMLVSDLFYFLFPNIVQFGWTDGASLCLLSFGWLILWLLKFVS